MENCLRTLRPFLDEEGRLTALPAKRTRKLAAYYYLASKIELGRDYTEGEINGLLERWTAFRDPETLRRELFNRRLLNRTRDGSRYWMEEALPGFPEFLEKNS